MLRDILNNPPLYIAFALIAVLLVGVLLMIWRITLEAWWPWSWPFHSSSNDSTTRATTSGNLSREDVKKLMRSVLSKEYGLTTGNAQTITNEIQRMQSAINELKQGQRKNEKWLAQMEKALPNDNKELAGNRHQPETQYGYKREATPIRQTSPGIDRAVKLPRVEPVSSHYSADFPSDLIWLYNAGVINPSDRDKFRIQFQPKRINTTNATERSKDPNLAPEFQTDDAGDYYAIQLERHSGRRYAVLPRFDLTFDEVILGPGAMGYVFDLPDYTPGLRYPRIKVLLPAVFESEGEHSWRRLERGKLDLGQGE
jgi:hypothetical protein